jgi:hypothetical protein
MNPTTHSTTISFQNSPLSLSVSITYSLIPWIPLHHVAYLVVIVFKADTPID